MLFFFFFKMVYKYNSLRWNAKKILIIILKHKLIHYLLKVMLLLLNVNININQNLPFSFIIIIQTFNP